MLVEFLGLEALLAGAKLADVDQRPHAIVLAAGAAALRAARLSTVHARAVVPRIAFFVSRCRCSRGSRPIIWRGVVDSFGELDLSRSTRRIGLMVMAARRGSYR